MVRADRRAYGRALTRPPPPVLYFVGDRKFADEAEAEAYARRRGLGVTRVVL